MFDNLKRWFMNLFGLTKQLIPEAGVQAEFYKEHMAQWLEIYRGYYEKWHNVTTQQGSRRMATMQVAKLLSSEIARLVFTEKVEIVVDNDKIQTYVDEVLKQNNFVINQKELIEYCFALGGAVNKCYRQDNKTVIDFVSADNFIPTQWGNSRINEGVFLTVTTKGEFNYILVEKHSMKGTTVTITYELFKQKVNAAASDKGVPVPLAEIYPDLEEQVIISNANTPVYSYFRPNTANNIDLNSPLGISIFANSMETIHSLDIAFDSFQREFVLGRKKIIVPSTALQAVKDPSTNKIHRYYDTTIDVYEGLNFDDDSSFKFQDDTQVLRVEEHVAAINALLNVLCIQVGLSVGFISFDVSGGLKTATEVVSENSKTFRTKTDHEQMIKKNLMELVDIIVMIGVLHGDIQKATYKTEIKFDDSIIEDKVAERTRDSLEVSQGNMMRWEFRMKWYNETKEEALAILAENTTVVTGEGDI